MEKGDRTTFTCTHLPKRRWISTCGWVEVCRACNECRLTEEPFTPGGFWIPAVRTEIRRDGQMWSYDREGRLMAHREGHGVICG